MRRLALTAALFVVFAGCSDSSEPGPVGACDPPRARQSGESCFACDHCVATADAIGFCQGITNTKAGTCVALHLGQEGDGPCVGTFSGGTLWASAPGGKLPDGATVCGLGAGCAPTELYCDHDTGKCKARNVLGAACSPCSSASSCSGTGPCVSSTYCASDSTCTPTKSTGAACADPSECGDGYCTKSLTCAAALSSGAECTADDRCKTYCSNGTCAATPGDACLGFGWSVTQ